MQCRSTIAVCLLQLFSFVAGTKPKEITSDEAEPVHLGSIMKQYLKTECDREQMSITLLNPPRSLRCQLPFMFLRLKFGGQCDSTFVDNGGYQLVAQHGTCAITRQTEPEKLIVHTATLEIVSKSPRTSAENATLNKYNCMVPLQTLSPLWSRGILLASVNISCSLPIIRPTSEWPINTALELYKETHPLERINPAHVSEPITIGDRIHAKIAADLLSSYPSDAYIYPARCWTSKLVDGPPESEHMFIEDGCPTLNAAGKAQAQLVFSKNSPYVSIIFPLTWALVTGGKTQLADGSPDGRVEPLFVTCDAFVCAANQSADPHNAIQCPPRTLCTDEPQDNSARRSSFADAQKFRVSEGPLLPLVPLSDLGAMDSSICEKMCRHPSSTRRPASGPMSTVVVMGISTWTSVALSIVSFGFGMALTAMLWFVHVHTDPKNKLTKKYENEAILVKTDQIQLLTASETILTRQL